ncbi:MAG TPA: hypothetical protein VEJ20_00995, partial [Candidatus Eremiobacteraceae bacterium]|nr:hypothetical protein [Candidatus Eremiobacteraceae bacterium]
MSSSLVVEAVNGAGRWHLLPGVENSFDLSIRNESDHSVLLKLNLDEPADAGALSPSSLTLKAGESRVVSLKFKAEWLTLRDRKIVVSVRNAAGTVLATFVHDLVAAMSTDCSVSLAWKDEIVGDGALRGFTLACAVRSISSSPGVFEPEFTPHPALRFPERQRITLGPGETSTFDVPVIWNRSARDAEGWNHPRTIEVGVPVTHGRRSANAPWDLVQQHIEPWLDDNDRAPVIVRRPPPAQFTTPGGSPPPAPLAVPAVSSLVPAPVPSPTLAPVVAESPAARIEQAEMEAGVVASGLPVAPRPASAPGVRPRGRDVVSISPATLTLLALAFGAIVITFVWILRPSTNTA